MTIFLVSSYWRGALNVTNMRVFHNLADAQAYRKTLKSYPDDSFTRVYQCSDVDPPILIRE